MKQVNENGDKANIICELMRSPEQVMKLDRLGSSHQTRLSFMRTLLRRLKRENWSFDRPVWSINDNGEGHAVYSAHGPRRTYSHVKIGVSIDQFGLLTTMVKVMLCILRMVRVALIV